MEVWCLVNSSSKKCRAGASSEGAHAQEAIAGDSPLGTTLMVLDAAGVGCAWLILRGEPCNAHALDPDSGGAGCSRSGQCVADAAGFSRG